MDAIVLLSAGTLVVETKLATSCACFRSAVETLASAKPQAVKTRLQFLDETFPNSLSEIGRESENVSCSSRGEQARSLCDAQNLYGWKRLVLLPS
jgi:hypothetical protein